MFDKLWEMVSAALGAALLLTGIAAAYYYAKAAHLEVKVAEQAKMIEEAKTVNVKCAADVDKQNGTINGWLAAARDVALAQKASAEASARAVDGMLKTAASILGAKPPADPKLDCAAVEAILDAELVRRGR